jgi:hypothetical protein
MRRAETLQGNANRPSVGECLIGYPVILLALGLALGSVVSGGCAVAPAVVVTSAAVSAAALVTEGEELIRDANQPISGMAENPTEIDPGPERG